MANKPDKKPSRFRLLRLLLRLVLAGILLICGALLWLNLVGLPAFLQARIASSLRGQGVVFEARQIKLSGFAQLLLVDSKISGIDPASPEVTAPEIAIQASLPNALRGIVDLESVQVKNGSIYLPSAEIDRSGEKELILQNAQALLSLNEAGNLKIDRADGLLFGIAVRSSGLVLNARDAFLGAKPSSAAQWDWRKTLEEVNSTLRKIQSPEPPVLDFVFRADARRPEYFQADLKFHALDAQSPWGRLGSAGVRFQVHPATNSPALLFSASIDVEDLASDWVSLAQASYDTAMTWPLATNAAFSGKGQLTLTNLTSLWASVPQIEMSFTSDQQTNSQSFKTHIESHARNFEFASTHIEGGRINLALSHEVPLRLGVGFGELSFATNAIGEWRLDLTNLTRPELTARQLQASGTLSNAPTQLATTAWGFWKPIANWSADFNAAFLDLVSSNVVLGNLNCTGSWKAPVLQVTEARSELYGGSAGFSAQLDVSRPALQSRFNAQYDYHETAPILDPPAQRWLAQFSWETPPALSGDVSFRLPGWTNSWENFRDVVLDSIDLKAHVKGSGAFREIPFDHVQTDVAFTNYIWRLPNLEIHRPEGHASADYQANDRTQNFVVYLNSHLDPHAILPLLDEEQREALKTVRFTTPPEIEGQLTGNWKHDDQITFDGKLRAQNFFIKKEPFLDIEARVAYTNLMVYVSDAMAHRVPGEEVRAPEVRIDITNRVMHVRDAISTMNPHIGMSLVGPVVYEAIEPYQFATPPLVRINGVVPLSEPPDAADLHFEVTGKDFSYWRFRIPAISGLVHWKDDDLTVTNVNASFYQGELLWHGQFHFNDDDTADFSFHGDVHQADAKMLLADIVTGKNNMEGTVDGSLHITSANSEDWNSWNGYGNGTLSDGFLWDIPVFALFTPMLEAIAPGLGVSRVTAGAVTFQITNSVIYTKDLEVRAPAFRLRYEGEVDFQGNIKARMEAMLLRDAPILGRAISTTLRPLSKVFEANISGTLEEPKSALRFIPAFITAPFKPVFNLRDLLRGSPRPEKPPAESDPPK